MKKENREKKREAEREAELKERERRFKRQGNICLTVIVVCAAAMLIVGRQNAGAAWLGNFYIAVGAVMAVTFIFSVRNVSRRLREIREEE